MRYLHAAEAQPCPAGGWGGGDPSLPDPGGSQHPNPRTAQQIYSLPSGTQLLTLMPVVSGSGSGPTAVSLLLCLHPDPHCSPGSSGPCRPWRPFCPHVSQVCLPALAYQGATAVPTRDDRTPRRPPTHPVLALDGREGFPGGPPPHRLLLSCAASQFSCV